MEEKKYEEIILKLEQDFRKSLEEDNQELVEAFRKYLYLDIDRITNSESKFIKKDESAIENSLKRETQRLINCDLTSKKKILLLDKNFEKIRKISGQLYDMAVKKLNGKEIKTTIQLDEEERKITELLNLVEDYNKEDARTLVSEAILDLRFLYGSQSEFLSLRLGNLKRVLNNQKSNEEEK